MADPLTIGAMVLPTALSLGKQFFGSGRQQNPYTEQQQQLASQLTEQATGSPFDTEGFRQGRSQLYDALSQQRQRDASNAAARGMSGGEFEIAQANQRGRRLSRGMGNLRREAEGLQSRRFAQALQATGQGSRQFERQQNRRDQRSNAAWQGAGNAFQNAALAYYLGRGGQGPSQTTRDNPWEADVGVHRNF